MTHEIHQSQAASIAPTPLSEGTRDKLLRCSTANVANALLKRGLRNTSLQGIKPVQAHTRMCGPAYTLRFIPAREDLDSMERYAQNDNLHRGAIELCPEGAVLVIDAFDNLKASSAGDVMALRLKVRGAAGIVTSGGFRDVPGMLAAGLPAYQRQGAQVATPVHMHPLELNRPIGCAGVAVYPGDIMLGDDDGLVCIPSHLAAEVAIDALAAEEYEVYAIWHLRHGSPLWGMFPASAASQKDYATWVAAGRPPLETWSKS
jgi:regulator of RNase E activity RraA